MGGGGSRFGSMASRDLRFSGGSNAFGPRGAGYGGYNAGGSFYSGPPAPDYSSGGGQSWW